jgi:hypothetical protein
MKNQTAKKNSLRNEESFNRAAQLPSGTFTRDGQPTIVTQIIALHLVNKMRNSKDSTKINDDQLRSEIVDHLDSLGLLPCGSVLDKSSKMVKISMALNYMIREFETVQTKHLNIYTACKIAMKRSMSQIKIAESHR